MIELRDVTVVEGAFELSNISFQLPACAFGVVVGAAGAGKTTLLEAIAGVRTLTSGSVVLGSRDVTHLAPELRSVGLVYQHGALFPHKSVLDNIAWSNARDERHARTIIERLGIAALIKTPIASLSGGERQLVALARALVRVRSCLDRHERALLLLDEPFSALDPRRKMSTRAMVRSIHAEWSLTTLQVTHDGADARAADVAVLLDAGRVVQFGSPSHLLSEPARDDVPLFLHA